MKKIIAIALMAISLGVMASPAKCLLNWAKAQGIDVIHEHTKMPTWGKYGEFDYNYQWLTYGYKIMASSDKLTQIMMSGPMHCGCSSWYDQLVKPGTNQATGLCGRW